MSHRIALIISLSCLLLATRADACSCQPEAYYLQPEAWAQERAGSTTDIIHARVTEVLANGDATIKILKVLMGAGKVEVLHPDPQMCGVRFTRGEEFIYILRPGALVHLCSRLKATPNLLRVMEQALSNRRPPVTEPPRRQ